MISLKTSHEDAEKYAVQHISSKGPSFGKAIHSLCISSCPHLSPNSYSNDQSSYDFVGNEISGSKEESDGTFYFKLKNYEVHQVVL